jgi:RNA polymerase sigma-54 factor
MLRPSLQIRLGQRLSMTPQLQQAIKLLQLPLLDLQQLITDTLDQNVMLEREDDDQDDALLTLDSLDRRADADEEIDGEVKDARDETTSLSINEETTPELTGADQWEQPSHSNEHSDFDRMAELADHAEENLTFHLMWQLEMSRLTPRQFAIGEAIIDAINDEGYLTQSLEEIVAAVGRDTTLVDADAVLQVIQAFDPLGVAARDLAECLTLQLQALDANTPGLSSALAMVATHLDWLADKAYASLKRTLNLDDQQLTEAIQLITHLNPKPGLVVQSGTTDYVIPDVVVRKFEGQWRVELNQGGLPKIRLNQTYAHLLADGVEHASLKTQLQEARWLLRSLEIRNETLLKVARGIVERQTPYFNEGEESMRPLVLRDIADAIHMHESTVSRVTTGKYMLTPRGVIEFKHFFSSHVASADGQDVSSTAIRAKIKKLINGESPAAPLSDSQLTTLLAQAGVQVARRTVAKYRESLNIPTSSERKRVHTS